MAEIKKMCENCKYCKAINSLSNFGIESVDKEFLLYECVRHPPQVDPDDTWLSSFPQIKRDGWCGEWKPKE